MRRQVISFIGKILVTAFWLVLIGYVAGTYLPHNSYTPSAKAKMYLKAILPEGWGFFTKNPQDKDVYIYRLDENNRWISALQTPNASIKNFIGLKRFARAQGAEYGMLLSKLAVDGVKWEEYKNLSHVECLDLLKCKTSARINHTHRNPTFCGKIWIILQRPVPWAWSAHEINMPLEIVSVVVDCSEQNV